MTTTITVRRTVAASPDQVFAAWTDAHRLARWWWPQLPGTTYDVDAREGRRFRIQSPVLGATVSGVYAEVDPPRRLVFSWVWQDDGEPEPDEDMVVVTFEPEAAGTTVTVEHTPAENASDADLEQGWNDVLDRLVGLGQSMSSRS